MPGAGQRLANAEEAGRRGAGCTHPPTGARPAGPEGYTP